jgi:hypothetical protein
LIALAALAIPAVLHLWRPPPSIVRVGTIPVLHRSRCSPPYEAAVARTIAARAPALVARSPRAVAGATDLEKSAANRAAALGPFRAGVVLQGDALKRWRDLDDRGFDARELARGFSRITAPVNGNGSGGVATDVWSLLREVDARLPRDSEVVVFASDRLIFLRGERPLMRRCKVEWVSASRADPAETAWISAARQVKSADASESKLRVHIAKSNEARTHRLDIDVAATAGRTALTGVMEGWSIDVSAATGGKLSARLLRAADGTPAGPLVPIADQQSLHVAIRHSAERAEDANYVRAAISAVADISGITISIADDIAVANWIIWLSDEPPPGDLVAQVSQRGATLLSDAENSEASKIATSTAIDAEGVHAPVALFRRVHPASRRLRRCGPTASVRRC